MCFLDVVCVLVRNIKNMRFAEIKENKKCLIHHIFSDATVDSLPQIKDQERLVSL